MQFLFEVAMGCRSLIVALVSVAPWPRTGGVLPLVIHVPRSIVLKQPFAFPSPFQISNVGTVMEELEYINVAAKTLDMDEIDRESLHLLIFLFMQFLSHSHQGRKEASR